MYLGKIMELADRDLLYKSPMHPYTKALMSAVRSGPGPQVDQERSASCYKGDVPSPISPPSGCRFHTRCWKATEICKTTEPPLKELRPGQRVACHHPENFEDQAPQDVVLLSDAKEAAELVSEKALAESAQTSGGGGRGGRGRHRSCRRRRDRRRGRRRGRRECQGAKGAGSTESTDEEPPAKEK